MSVNKADKSMDFKIQSAKAPGIDTTHVIAPGAVNVNLMWGDQQITLNDTVSTLN